MSVSAAIDAADRSFDWSSSRERSVWREQEVRAASARQASEVILCTQQRCSKVLRCLLVTYYGVDWYAPLSGYALHSNSATLRGGAGRRFVPSHQQRKSWDSLLRTFLHKAAQLALTAVFSDVQLQNAIRGVMKESVRKRLS